MELDAEAVPDQPGDPRPRPQLGGEAELGRRSLDPGEDLPLLVTVELGLGAGVGDGGQGLVAPVACGGDPAADAAIGDAQHAGDLGGRRSLTDGLDGALTPALKFLRAALRSHAARRHKSSWRGNIRIGQDPKHLADVINLMVNRNYLAQAYASTRGSAPALRTPVFGSMAMAAFEPNDHAPADCNL